MAMLEYVWPSYLQMRCVAGKVYGDPADLRYLAAGQGLKPGTGTPAQRRLYY
jgi:hypothetical protein